MRNSSVAGMLLGVGVGTVAVGAAGTTRPLPRGPLVTLIVNYLDHG